jgi:hypothetical protein
MRRRDHRTGGDDRWRGGGDDGWWRWTSNKSGLRIGRPTVSHRIEIGAKRPNRLRSYRRMHIGRSVVWRVSDRSAPLHAPREYQGGKRSCQ